MDKLIKFLDLQYPQTTPFPNQGLWRHFTLVTVFLMTAAVVFITVLSAAAVGYELEPYYSTDFNPNFDLWWSVLSSTAIVKGRANCDAKVFNLRDTFMTTLNMFQYTVDSIGFRWDTGNAKPPNAFAYNGTTFETCALQRVSITIAQPLVTTLTGHVSCTLTDVNLNMTTSLTISLDRDKDTLFSRFLSHEDTFVTRLYSDPVSSPVLLTLNGLSVDALNALYTISPNPLTGEYPTSRHLSYSYSPRPGAAWNWTDSAFFRGFDSGYLEFFALESASSLAVAGNLIKLFSAAVLVDLGERDTAFHNLDMFRRSLDRTFNDTETRNSSLRIQWTPAAGLPSYQSPFASQLRDNNAAFGINVPIPWNGRQYIDTTYFCRRWRRKSVTGFLGAVAAATISFTMALWGTYMFAAAWLAKKESSDVEKAPKALETKAANSDEEVAKDEKQAAKTEKQAELNDVAVLNRESSSAPGGSGNVTPQ